MYLDWLIYLSCIYIYSTCISTCTVQYIQGTCVTTYRKHINIFYCEYSVYYIIIYIYISFCLIFSAKTDSLYIYTCRPTYKHIWYMYLKYVSIKHIILYQCIQYIWLIKMFISSFEFTEHSKLKNFLTVVEVLATIGSIKTYCSKTYCINFMVNISVLKDIYNTKF